MDDPGWAQATNKRAGIPYERDVIAELDAENARLHGELIDVQCELVTARLRLRRLEPVASYARSYVQAIANGRVHATAQAEVRLTSAVRTLDAK